MKYLDSPAGPDLPSHWTRNFQLCSTFPMLESRRPAPHSSLLTNIEIVSSILLPTCSQ